MTEQTGTDHERYGDWDGAYVVGALSHADRQEFERHLAGCHACRAAVAALAPLPGLLGRLDPAEAAALLGEDTETAGPALPPELEYRLLAAAGHTQPSFWRRTSTRVGVALAAAAAVAAIAVPVAVHESGNDSRMVAVDVRLAQRIPSPLSADVALTPTAWGTKIDMTCVYKEEPGGHEADHPHSYSLYVLDASGRAELVSRWHAAPGETSRTTGSTDLAVGDIRQVQLRDGSGSTVLLARAISS